MKSKNQIMMVSKAWYGDYLHDRKQNAEAAGVSAFFERALTPESILSMDDTGATVTIDGPLSQDGPDALDLFLGYNGVSYDAIQEAVMEAHETLALDKTLKLVVNTPGGDLSGTESTYMLIKEIAAERNVVAYVNGMCASAGIWITAACSEIIAIGSTCLIGSIGVATRVVDYSKMYEEAGIQVLDLTNDQSTDKRPDTSTDEGKGVVISELNSLYEVFISNEVEGRSGRVTRESIEGLKGAVVTSEEAVKVGLIDNVELPTFGIKGPDKGLQGEHDMESLAEFLAKNPNAKAEHDKAVAAALAQGRSEEQEAVKRRSDEMATFLDSDSYDATVKQSCIKAITGERSIDAAKDLVAMVDKLNEKKKSDAAAADTDDQEDTPAPDAVKLKAETEQRAVDARTNALLGGL